jgi:hypothetical protein
VAFEIVFEQSGYAPCGRKSAVLGVMRQRLMTFAVGQVGARAFRAQVDLPQLHPSTPIKPSKLNRIVFQISLLVLRG